MPRNKAIISTGLSAEVERHRTDTARGSRLTSSGDTRGLVKVSAMRLSARVDNTIDLPTFWYQDGMLVKEHRYVLSPRVSDAQSTVRHPAGWVVCRLFVRVRGTSQ